MFSMEDDSLKDQMKIVLGNSEKFFQPGMNSISSDNGTISSSYKVVEPTMFRDHILNSKGSDLTDLISVLSLGISQDDMTRLVEKSGTTPAGVELDEVIAIRVSSPVKNKRNTK